MLPVATAPNAVVFSSGKIVAASYDAHGLSAEHCWGINNCVPQLVVDLAFNLKIFSLAYSQGGFCHHQADQ